MNQLATEARALCEGATDGPWLAKEKQDYSEVWDNDSWAKGFKPLAMVGSSHEDASLIARSRTLLPEMADEIERLANKNESLKVALKSIQGLARECGDKFQTTKAELDALKADIEAGRLVRLPCREVFSEAGNNMFMAHEGEVVEVMHCGARIDPYGNVWAVLSAGDRIFPYREPDVMYDTEPSDWCRDWTTADAKDFGKTLFLTEAEALAAMKEDAHD